MIRFVESLLGREGFEVVAVRDGQELVDTVHRVQPDLVVVDIMMPGLNGFEAIRHVRRDPAMVRVPILVCSSLTDREYMLAAFDAGADDYLAKPFEPEELLLRVLKLTRGPSAPEPLDIGSQDVSSCIRDLAISLEKTLLQVEGRARAGQDTEHLHRRTGELFAALRGLADSLEGDEADMSEALSRLEILRRLLDKPTEHDS